MKMLIRKKKWIGDIKSLRIFAKSRMLFNLRYIISGLFVIWQIGLSYSQGGNLPAIEDDLVFYADVLVNADAPKHRIQTHEKFYKGLREFLVKEGSFHLSLDSLKWISVQYPEDQSFRIISWQLSKSETEFEYFSFIQLSSGEMWELKGRAHPDMDIAYSQLTPDEYIPQLIYRIKRNDTEDGSYYFIFGYAQLDAFTKMKSIDVLDLEGTPIRFGKPVFISGDEATDPKSRLILKYSADAQVSLVYNPGLDMIIFDHLIQRIGRIPGQGITYLPDGSYEGYQRAENGKWEYVEKIYDQILESAPRPNPLDSDQSKDLFGRKKKNGG